VRLNIFVYEYITGGGLAKQALPASLAREGALMRDAVLGDLSQLPHTVICTCDSRVAHTQEHPAMTYLAVSAQDDMLAIFTQQVIVADAVLIIAPETEGVLQQLSEIVLKHNKCLLGASPQAVAVAADKWLTAQCLRQHAIATVPTFLPEQAWQDADQAWVAKKRDGVSCEDSRYFTDAQALGDWLRNKQTTHIVQPYQAGVAASLSVLCKAGQAWVLSCNLQKIELQESVFSYVGGVLNGCSEYHAAFSQIAQEVAQAIPGLMGYAGIDVIIGDSQISVIDINPRLTTSYVGLHKAILYNPAKLILDLFYNEDFVMPQLANQQVDITLYAE
jgi:tyramine---L-glutamate ligase